MVRVKDLIEMDLEEPVAPERGIQCDHCVYCYEGDCTEGMEPNGNECAGYEPPLEW